jgi:hypothetical protein
VLWSIAGTTLRRSIPASMVVLAFLFAGWSAAPHPWPGPGVVIHPLHQVERYKPLRADLLQLADRGLVYTTIYSDLNVSKQRVIYPNYYNFADLLAAGSQPLALVRAFEDRRFAFVEMLPGTPEDSSYMSGYGQWEENWTWKVNQVIAARYSESRRSAPLLEPRPGPERAVWQRACFGPFTLAGTHWRIGLGGGFWCNPESGLVTQRGTPATVAVTELRTDVPVEGLHGLLRLKLAVGHLLRISQGDAAKPRTAVLVERPSATQYQVSVTLGATFPATRSVSVGRNGLLRLTLNRGSPSVTIDDRAAGSAAATLPMAKDIVRLHTDRGSDLRLDLRSAHTG